MELMVKAAGSVTEGVWMVENNSASFHGVIVARAIACPKDGLIPIRVINPRHCSLPLKKGVELAKMEIIEQDCISTVSAPGKQIIEGVSSVDQETLWSLASKHLNTQEKEHLFLLLPYPDYSKRFILDTDASNYGIGAVLSQISNDGSECVIAYASRSLSRQEQRYCVTRRELLAIVEFVQHFRQYLLGRQFTLRTDHGSLVWVRNFKEPEGQLARWLERLEEYDFSVIHLNTPMQMPFPEVLVSNVAVAAIFTMVEPKLL
ncbi:hypothetical protein EMCRGX_G009089 [Ephydatia muelleri]